MLIDANIIKGSLPKNVFMAYLTILTSITILFCHENLESPKPLGWMGGVCCLGLTSKKKFFDGGFSNGKYDNCKHDNRPLLMVNMIIVNIILKVYDL